MRKEDLEAHLRKRAYERRTRHEFPEIDLGNGPLVVFVRPFTIGDIHKYGERLQKEDVSAIVELFIEKAEDENGNLHFTKEMSKLLMETLESDTITRMSEIVQGIGIAQRVEEAAGNSAGMAVVGG